MRLHPILLGSLPLTFALSTVKRDNPAVLNVPIEHGPSRVTKRDQTLDIPGNSANFTIPTANMSVGTPPQNMEAVLSTGGNECWVLKLSESCEHIDNPIMCNETIRFNASASSTANELNGDAFALPGTNESSGKLYTDVLRIGDEKVGKMTFGVPNYPGRGNNQLGLGYGNSTFTSLPKALSDSGIINSPAFSVWSEDSTHGSVLFGGVDKDKYTGSLNTLPVVDGKGSRKAFRVNLTNLSIDKKSVSSDSLPVNAILNTGYAFTYVPQSLAEGLFAQVKPNMANVTGKLQISIPCEQPNKTISFIFGQASFDLDLQHFVTRYAPIQNYPGPEGGCYLGIVASHNPRNEGDVVLGMNFLSRMYTVFDMENHEVSLAERNWDSSSSDVHEIGKGKKNDSSGGEGEGEGEGDGDGDDKESMGIHVELSGLWTLAGIAVVGMYMCIWT